MFKVLNKKTEQKLDDVYYPEEEEQSVLDNISDDDYLPEPEIYHLEERPLTRPEMDLGRFPFACLWDDGAIISSWMQYIPWLISFFTGLLFGFFIFHK